MSRRRWLVLLGPPILIAGVAAPALSGVRPMVVGATSLLPARPVEACPAGQSGRAAAAAAAPWSELRPRLDASGTLEGWSLRIGVEGVAGARPASLTLPAASTVAEPRAGLVVVTSEPQAGERHSVIRIVDAERGCATTINVPDRLVRRAVADPRGTGVLAHLLDPASRADVGVWRTGSNGQVGERVLGPLPAVLRGAAGIDRIWSTELRLDDRGSRLAVQSCHPATCLTRVVELATGSVTVVAGPGQGSLVGFRDDELITWAACRGLPCDLLAWPVDGRGSRVLAHDAVDASEVLP